MIKTGSMYVRYSATATAVFKQFCLYWLSYTCTTGTLTTHNSVILVATATTQSADCNYYQFLPHIKNVLWLFILVLHACPNSSIMFHWTQKFLFETTECYTQLQNRISDVMAQKKSFGNTKKDVTYMSILLGL